MRSINGASSAAAVGGWISGTERLVMEKVLEVLTVSSRRAVKDLEGVVAVMWCLWRRGRSSAAGEVVDDSDSDGGSGKIADVKVSGVKTWR